MDITGTMEKGAINTYWKSTKQEEVRCDSISIRPGDIRTLGVWLQFLVC